MYLFMKRSFFKHYIKNKYVFIFVVILAIVLVFIFYNRNPAVNIEFAVATVGNITEKVSVTGKISPVGKADLAFEKGGIIKTINVKVGDKIEKGSLIAGLNSSGDAANLASAQAKLDDLSRNLNSQELAVEQSKVNTAKVSLANAKQEAFDASRTAYVQAQSAITNYADSLFDSPQSANPEIKVRTQSQTEKNTINMSRISVAETLVKWKADIDAVTSTDNINILISKADMYVNVVRDFMSSLSTIVNNLNLGNSGLTQATIDTYVSSINSGLTLTNQAIASITSAKTGLENALSAYEQADSNFILRKTGSSAQTIAAQAALVAAYKAEYEKDRIVSPISGIITRADPSVGEFVQAGKIVYGVQSDDVYKIEAYVPEADIAKIVIGNYASTTLDAYGQNVDFPAVAVTMDPAETILEGVPTYKVTLHFLQKDERIRSGMTANLDILTRERSNVITVPTRTIIDVSGTKNVRLLGSDGKSFVSIPVEVGLKGSDGMVEIISGLRAGDKIVTYVK
jgi:HlyD family secretion protein